MRHQNQLNHKFLNPFILALLGAVLLRISWHKWANITVDYGRELYTPWRITCGQVLYKDIASLFGPFPPYWNALLFKMFGTSIMTLVLFNILLVAGITILIYRFFNDTMDRRVALFASAAFLSLFAFQQSHLYWDLGNFSYICPYSYSVTYAVFFSLWAMDRFVAYGRTGRDAWLGAVGVLIGLTALCRFEIFIFLAIALALGVISKGIIGRWPLGRFLKAVAILLGGFFVPIIIAYLYFSTQLPLSQVVPSIFGFNDSWFKILSHRYYQMTIGLNDPWHNFMVMLITGACYGLVIIAVKCLCMGAERLDKNIWRWQGAIFILLGLAGIVQVGIWIVSFYDDGIFRGLLQVVNNVGIFKGLPVVVIFMVGYVSLLLVRHQRDEEKLRRILPLWVMAVWGLLMLTKVFLNVRINSEGFVYTMPAAMLFVALFLGFVPQYFERIHPRVYFVPTLISALLVLIFIVGMRSAINVYQSRYFYIRSGSDMIICRMFPWYYYDTQIGEMATFIKNVDHIIGKDTNFVAFPQGAMLNFLTKRINPLPYNAFIFAEVFKYGEARMLSSFKEHKPDYIVLSNQGLPAQYDKGRMYPYVIRGWILANYYPVWPAHAGIGNMITVYKRSK